MPLIVGGAAKMIGAWIGSRLGKPVVGPALGTLIVTYRCNYSCQFCELPARAVRRSREGAKEFGRAGMLAVVRGFKSIRTAAVGITGGEPFLREDLFDIVAEIHRLGMVAHVNTNGHFLEAGKVARLLGSGVDSVNVSLDSAVALTHDTVRGRRGSHGRILSGLGEVLRQRRGGKPRVCLVTVLGPETLDRAEGMVRLAREIGVDGVGFLPLHSYRDGAPADSMIPAREFAGRAEEVIRRLVEEGRGIVDNSEGYLGLFPRCFSGQPSGLRCYAPYASMVVDNRGLAESPAMHSHVQDRTLEVDLRLLSLVLPAGSVTVGHIEHREVQQGIRESGLAVLNVTRALPDVLASLFA
ncbi:MAG: radical SAM protein, partial [Planctomycetes bacterium]|nr:radical SAM protein [Planctomycetota bacterium]